MRIGIDLSPLAYGNQARGVGIYAENLLPALAEMDRADEYWIFTAGAAPDPDWLRRLPPTWQQVRVPTPHWGRLSPLISHQLVLPIQLAQVKLDLVHFIGVPYNPSIPGIPWWGTTRMVATVHDLTPLVLDRHVLVHWRYRAFYHLQLRACRRAARLIADSKNTAADVVRFGVAPPDRVSVVPLAAPQCEPAPLPPGLADLAAAPFILHVGGADYQKNQSAVLRAYAELCRDPEFTHHLVLVGARHLENEIATTLEPEVARRIIRLSRLGRSELAGLYSSCDVFVFPSLYEGFGLPVLEAMSCGAPVIASNTSSVPEVAGGAALLVDPTDHRALAAAVRKMLGDRRLRDECIEAGYRRARQFSWERTAEQTCAVYEQIARTNSLA